MAPSSAVNPAPTWAARVTPAISGVISLVFAKAEMNPVKASAPISWSPLNPSSPYAASPESVPLRPCFFIFAVWYLLSSVGVT